MGSEKRPPPDDRLIVWLRRINTEYAPILRWVGLVGMVIGFALNRPELATAFGGLIPLSLVVGKD